MWSKHSQNPSHTYLQMGLLVKQPPANAGDRETQFRSLCQEDPLNGNPLQYSCRENPTDKGAWRATAHRVAKSQTRLRRLSTHTRKLSRLYTSCPDCGNLLGQPQLTNTGPEGKTFPPPSHKATKVYGPNYSVPQTVTSFHLRTPGNIPETKCALVWPE